MELSRLSSFYDQGIKLLPEKMCDDRNEIENDKE